VAEVEQGSTIDFGESPPAATFLEVGERRSVSLKGIGRPLQAGFVQKLFAGPLHAQTYCTLVSANGYADRACSLCGDMPLQRQLTLDALCQVHPMAPAAFAPVGRDTAGK
jgi:hypothetical protein